MLIYITTEECIDLNLRSKCRKKFSFPVCGTPARENGRIICFALLVKINHRTHFSFSLVPAIFNQYQLFNCTDVCRIIHAKYDL